ncbi:hypothetical protein SDC9_120732 [bioreactor metagenome]|uniref:Uncharacterized protein n=1 Tax=bioreactor metagenome TaxID=1076179 RepID=A0A645CA00_9ZZZZ
MGAADLDNVSILPLQPRQRPAQTLRRGQNAALHRQHRRNMQRGGKGIVAGLGGVHVVVGVELDALFRRQMGDHLVDVHVRLGAGAGLPNRQRKLPVPFPRPDFPTDGGNGVRLLRRQLTAVCVGPGAGLLQAGKSRYNLLGHLLRADFKVFKAPLRLRPPKMLRRDKYLAHGVVLESCWHNVLPRFHDIFSIIAGFTPPRKSPVQGTVFFHRRDFCPGTHSGYWKTAGFRAAVLS